MWDTLSSFTEQITHFASEAMSPDEDEDERVSLSQDVQVSLNNRAQKAEIERYKEEILELQERLAAGELLYSNVSKTEGEEPERLPTGAKEGPFYLEEPIEGTVGNVGAPSSLPRSASIEFFGAEASPVSDEIQGELETKRLPALLAKVQAENLRLRGQVTELAASGEANRGEWRKLEEEHQQEVAALQALQQERLRQLAASHQEDLAFLQEKQGEADARIAELVKLLAERDSRVESLQQENELQRQELEAREKERANQREKLETLHEQDKRARERLHRQTGGVEGSGLPLREGLEQDSPRENEREVERLEKQNEQERTKFEQREKEWQAAVAKEREQAHVLQLKYASAQEQLDAVEKKHSDAISLVDKLKVQEEAMMQTIQALVCQKESLLKEREETADTLRSLKDESSETGEGLSLVELARRLKKAFSTMVVEVQRLEQTKGRMEREVDALKKDFEIMTDEKKALLARVEVMERVRQEDSKDKETLVAKEKQSVESMAAEIQSPKALYEAKLAEAAQAHHRESEKRPAKELKQLRLASENETRKEKPVVLATAHEAAEEFSTCARCFVLEQENNALQESLMLLREQNRMFTDRVGSEKTREDELQELKDKYEKMSKDLVRLRAHLLEKEDVHNLELVEGARRIEELQKKLDDSLAKENHMHGAVVKYERLLSDYKEKEVECEQNAIAVANLQSVLEQLQAEQDAQMSYELGRLNRELNLARDQSKVLQDKVQDAEKLRKRCEEAENLTSKQQEMLSNKSREIVKLQEEVEPLRRGLEECLRRLHNATESGKTLVDKRLVSKLFVTYFSRASNQNEVLSIMANILGFSQEEKIQVGLLKNPNSRGWSFFGGWGGGTDSASNSSSSSVEGKDKTLTDLWVEFLLKEASATEGSRQQQDERTKGKEKEQEKGKESDKERVDDSYQTGPDEAAIGPWVQSRSNALSSRDHPSDN